jgi:hypothetical protein
VFKTRQRPQLDQKLGLLLQLLSLLPVVVVIVALVLLINAIGVSVPLVVQTQPGTPRGAE